MAGLYVILDWPHAGGLDAASAARGLVGDKLNFLEVKFSSANFAGAALSGSNFIKLDLNGSSFAGATLEACTFVECEAPRIDFSGANLKMASFFQAAVSAANLEQAQLDGAIWLDKQVCSKGSLGKCLVTPQTAQPQPTQTTATTQPAAQTAGAKTPAPADKPAAGK